MYTYGGSMCQDKYLTDVVFLSFYDTESKSIECGFLGNDPLVLKLNISKHVQNCITNKKYKIHFCIGAYTL